MKICWNNLEKIEYRPDRKEWQDKNWKNVFYIYKDSCKNCGEPFLAQKKESEFCDKSCAKKDRRHSEETKRKISESQKGRNNSFYGKKHSEKVKQRINRKGCDSSGWKSGYASNNIPLYDTYATQISFCEEVRRNKQDQNILEVKCAYCGKWFIPKLQSVKNRIRALNVNEGEQRLYCSDNCKQECPIYNQHKWPKDFKPATSREVQPELRQICLERDNYTCQKCGKYQNELDVGLHCHHIEGIRWEPLESADLDKVITFCKDCHIEVHKQPDCGYHDMKCN